MIFFLINFLRRRLGAAKNDWQKVMTFVNIKKTYIKSQNLSLCLGLSNTNQKQEDRRALSESVLFYEKLCETFDIT